jgi:adenine/guanine phosphoribosyltransferase-like PRPP-binding protein
MPSVVKFPTRFGAASLERTLAYHYDSSLKSDQIVFSFELVQECEWSALPMLVVWIRQLLAAGKKVEFIHPSGAPLEFETSFANVSRRTNEASRSDVLSNLRLIGMLPRLRQEGLTVGGRLDKMADRAADLPFVFYLDRVEALAGFLEALTYSQGPLFGSTSQAVADEHPGLRDIVVRELVMNIFDHADGHSGVVAAELRTNQLYDDERLPSFERAFLATLGTQPFLIVSVSDSGRGIATSLRRTFKGDLSVPEALRTRARDSSIVDYAFRRNSSSKNPRDQLAALEALIDEADPVSASPGTGLYWVRELARAKRALLVVRSGKICVRYAYPNPEATHSQLTVSPSDFGIQSLTDFPGTHIRLYVPLHPARTVVARLQLGLPAVSRTARSIQYVRLKATPVTDDPDSHALAEWLRDELRQLRAAAEKEGPTTIFVDLQGFTFQPWRARKALFIYLIECMRVQGQKVHVIVVGGSSTVASLLKDFQLPRVGPGDFIRERPLLMLGDDGAATLVGLRPELTAIAEFVRTGKAVLQSDVHRGDVPDELNHLFERNHSGDWVATYANARLWLPVTEELERTLADWILDENHRAFYSRPRQAFLIPSISYASGYFALRRLFDDEWAAKILKQWLGLVIAQCDPTKVVVAGHSLGQIVRSLQEDNRWELLQIRAPHTDTSVLPMGRIAKEDRVLVIVDVIGTATTLNRILSWVGARQILSLLCVVDARESPGSDEYINLGTTRLPLRRVLRYGLRYFDQKPGPAEIDRVIRIDPHTGLPETEERAAEPPLWLDFADVADRETWAAMLRSTDAVERGHFENDGRHIIYLLDWDRLLGSAAAEIAERIVGDVEKHIEKPTTRVTHLVYPKRSIGVMRMAERLRGTFEQAQSLGLAREVLANPSLAEPGLKFPSVVLAVDDAVASGSTAQQIIDRAARQGAEAILMYAFVNRAGDDAASWLESVRNYAGSAVRLRFLVRFPVPNYGASDCPICKSRDRLERIHEIVGETFELSAAVERELKRLAPVHLDSPNSSWAGDLAVKLRALQRDPVDMRVRQAIIRAQLERSKYSLEERAALRGLLRTAEVQSEDAALLIETIAYEELAFTEDTTTFQDLFYPSFRLDLVECANALLADPDKLSETRFGAAVRTLRLFDSDALLSRLASLNGRQLTPGRIANVAIEALISQDLRDKAEAMGQIMSGWINDDPSLSVEVAPIVEFWGRESKRFHSDDLVRKYVGLRDALGSTGGLDVLLNKLLNSDWTPPGKPTLLQQWRQLMSKVEADVLPVIRDLASSGAFGQLGDDLLEALRSLSDSLFEVDSLVDVLESLGSAVALDALETRRLKELVPEAIRANLAECYEGLLGFNDWSVRRLTDAMMTDITDVINLAVMKRKDDLRVGGIRVDFELPQEPRIVFGSVDDLQLLVDALVDNAIKWAFDGVDPTARRVHISIWDDPEGGTVTLQVRDSGRQFPMGWQYKVGGLAQVAAICRKVGAGPWQRQQLNVPPYTKQVSVTLYRI